MIMCLKSVIFTIKCNGYTCAVAESIKQELQSLYCISVIMNACLPVVFSRCMLTDLCEVELESTALLDSISVQQQVDSSRVLELQSVIALGTAQCCKLTLV